MTDLGGKIEPRKRSTAVNINRENSLSGRFELRLDKFHFHFVLTVSNVESVTCRAFAHRLINRIVIGTKNIQTCLERTRNILRSFPSSVSVGSEVRLPYSSRCIDHLSVRTAVDRYPVSLRRIVIYDLGNVDNDARTGASNCTENVYSVCEVDGPFSF